MATKRGRYEASDLGPERDPDARDDDDGLEDEQGPALGAMSMTMPPPPSKRRRMNNTATTPSTALPRTHRDRLSPLSDELLIRILSFLPLQQLLAVSPVSRRFYHLSGDSQLWKALYYARFVLPRAMRIPGFRDGVSGSGAGHKLHYSGRRTLWADGRRGGLVSAEEDKRKDRRKEEEEDEFAQAQKNDQDVPKSKIGVNWKRQFKIRYNWSRGKCAVEELRVDGETEENGQKGGKMLVKVVEGIAITADKASGLRAWDLKTRQLLVQTRLTMNEIDIAPSCIAIDDKELDNESLDVAVGFPDGSFGVWTLLTGEKQLAPRYRHEKSSNGGLVAMAFSYPYLLTATATNSVLVSLYTFEVPAQIETGPAGARQRDEKPEPAKGSVSQAGIGSTEETCADAVASHLPPLTAPYLLTSLNSHTSRPPLALSIRKMATTTIASIAYTFSTRQGWSIGVQDLHIRPSIIGSKSAPEITTTRIAYTTPVDASGVSHSPPSSPAPPRRRSGSGSRLLQPVSSSAASPSSSNPPSPEPGPTTLCYTHPYLLATLPDNTLVLHMCTSNASSLSISRGIRLWGHTSGISDAEITARGKAVSVSSRGDEMRVWELEGRANGMGSRSVEIRPGGQSSTNGFAQTSLGDGKNLDGTDSSNSLGYDWDERRNWVGFDDEMVIVLKEKKGGRESLMVYDFT
ncbi:hypothetical protein B0T22DRAFT_478304 [Podospora appendiculata]|uniref:F-box domain-containing protein n=1 Tax=Podospora appendiculata TaxID=314037 RepID=A0AAE0XLX1_9PEZI|nr:hypothetical protein B0T22DRAFT_478304 [Podospora appendiculata]